jgi:hypothetical protein
VTAAAGLLRGLPGGVGVEAKGQAPCTQHTTSGSWDFVRETIQAHVYGSRLVERESWSGRSSG